jgi:hypothetical protein
VRLTYKHLFDHLFIRFRRRRMKMFFELFAPAETAHVVDIGGLVTTWLGQANEEFARFPVTIVNHRDYPVIDPIRFRAVSADARTLPFCDGEFDIAFSNSVIEHVGTWEDQKAFAREASRVAMGLWIQTPARSFPIEPHLLAPYVQYLSRPMQHRVARWTLRGWMQPDRVHRIIDDIRLLTYREMKELFPDCTILRERVMGLTKSYIAVRMENTP